MKKLSTLQIAVAISVALHVVPLTVRFVDPQGFTRAFEKMPLEVILVNSRSNDKPDEAQAIAQTSLAGGGEQEKGRATSPLPPSLQMKPGDATEDGQRKIESLQKQQTELLVQLKTALAALPPPPPVQPDTTPPPSSPEELAQEEKRKQLSNLLAEIEKRINQENARPKKHYISPATQEAVYALYYDELRRKIEQKGTANFPQTAGKKLYGELTMTLTVNFDGQVLDTEIIESSGIQQLDRRAQTIARSAGPFSRFSKAMRSEGEQIVLVSHFNFARDDSLETKLSAEP